MFQTTNQGCFSSSMNTMSSSMISMFPAGIPEFAGFQNLLGLSKAEIFPNKTTNNKGK